MSPTPTPSPLASSTPYAGSDHPFARVIDTFHYYLQTGKSLAEKEEEERENKTEYITNSAPWKFDGEKPKLVMVNKLKPGQKGLSASRWAHRKVGEEGFGGSTGEQQFARTLRS